MAGQVVPCPSCQEPLPISASQPRSSMDSLLDDVGIDLKGDSTGKCPSCYAALKPNAVICISCGINLESRVSVVKKKKKDFIQRTPDEAASLGDSRLDRAAKELAQDATDAKTSHDPIAWWIWLAALDLLLSLCVTAAVMMMTIDDLKSRRMMKMSIDSEVVNKGGDNIVVIATKAFSYTHPPPYGEDETGNFQMSSTMGQLLETRDGYSRIETSKETIWIRDSALVEVDRAILQENIDAKNNGRKMTDLKYGFYKGITIGMMVMAFLSGVITVLAVGQITVSAFQEDATQGALCLTIGYAPYYALTRWYKLKGSFKMFVFGVVLFIVAIIAYSMVPNILPLVRGNVME